MRKYIALFKIYSGECQYDNYQTYETSDKKTEVEKWFKEFECDNNNEIWKLIIFQEVENFKELWKFMR